jgi:hypothetical protein
LRIRRYAVQRQSERADFFLIFFLLGLVAYALWGGVWGKYAFPVVLAGVIAAGHELAVWLQSVRVTHWVVFSFLVALLAIFHFLAIPALQVRPGGFYLLSVGLRQAVLDIRNLYVLATLAGFGVFVFFARRFVVGARKQTSLAAVLVVYVLVANPINSAKVLLSSADRSPYRPFEDRGFRETVDYLNRNLEPTDVIVCPKDIGFYFKGKHYPTESILALDGLGELARLVSSPEVRYIIDSEKYPTIPAGNLTLNGSSLLRVEQISDYVVYAHRPPRQTSPGGYHQGRRG